MLKSFIKIGLILLIGIQAYAQKNQKPNILLINVDDMGWADVGYNGGKEYHTPNIDKLANESIIFPNGYAGAANCAPSRACLMTGQTTSRHGISTVPPANRGPVFSRKLNAVPTEKHLKGGAYTMGSLLQQNGYQTAIFGKWHLSEDARYHGFDYAIAAGPKGHPNSYFSPYSLFNIEDGEDGEYLTDRLTDEAIIYLKKERKKKQPFFLYLPYYAIHTPLMGKQALKQKYKGVKQKDGHGVNLDYAALIENTDWNVGRLLETLDKLKLTDNTIIIFTSDNGGIYTYSHQLPLRAGKGSYYEGGIKVPTLFKWKGKWAEGKEIQNRVTHLDYLPTVLELTGTEMPANYPLDGNSIVPLLADEGSFENDRPIFFHFPIYLQAYSKGGDDARDALFRTRPGSVVIKGNWKLHYYYEDNAKELYNLENDISERDNLADKNPQKANEMYQLLQDWLKETGSKTPTEANPKYDAAKEKTELEKYQ
ncbi:sulfatase [Flammeovirga aprica]|uniref:Sulfatase n=1 Tax=Flammeovirga aprica JL-4 TaxID=694437 RepID=A0A7X9RWS9_9BACT|nr:sulfatase [Flammeovirga aprica]NME70147.1 sulfatase [Flammeovirga aprica JL-4]